MKRLVPPPTQCGRRLTRLSPGPRTPDYRAVLLRRMVCEVLPSRWLQRTCSCGGRKQGAYRLGKCSYGEATCTSPACFILPHRSLWSVRSERSFGWGATKASFSGRPQCPNTSPAEGYVEIIARCAICAHHPRRKISEGWQSAAGIEHASDWGRRKYAWDTACLCIRTAGRNLVSRHPGAKRFQRFSFQGSVPFLD